MRKGAAAFVEAKKRELDALWAEFHRTDPLGAALAELELLMSDPDYVDETERCIQRGED